MNKTILSKLTFSDIGNNTAVPSPYNDNNKYSTLIWTKSSTPTITVVDNKHMINISHINYRLQSQSNYFSASSFIVNDFELDVNVRLSSINSMNGFYGVTLGTGNAWISYYIKNTFIGGITITSASGNELSFNYKFEKDVDYNIIISFIDYKYRLIINGEIIGYIEKSDFKEMLRNTNAGMSMFVLGSVSVTSNNANNLSTGQMWNINTSLGPGIKNEDASHLTKYGTNLLTRLNFDNLQSSSTSTVFTADLESMYDPAVYWDYDDTKVNKYNVNTTFTTNIDTNFTALIKMSNNKNRTDVGLITYGNYKVTYNYISIGEPEPIVVVDTYTKSALDFENGIIDAISTTVWAKEGANITSVNKIFGTNSFETKALGDSLYTNSNIITGGSTPFTIEFYVLIKGGSRGSLASNQYYPILSKSDKKDSANQFFRLNNYGFLSYYRYKNIGSDNSDNNVDYTTSKKINFNELNKYNFTYDGSATRFFVNDELVGVLGINKSIITDTYYPFKFFDTYTGALDYNDISVKGYQQTTMGIIDNINIHDGIATKVRDYDPYEKYLVVDLAFDGENNSTKIVDNARLNERNEIKYNDYVVSLLHFDDNIKDETNHIFTNSTSSTFKDDVFNKSLIFSGNHISTPYSSDFDFGVSDFTVELFTTFSSLPSNYVYSLAGTYLYNDGWVLQFRNDEGKGNRLRFAIGDTNYIDVDWTPIINKRYHIVASRYNGTISIFVDGIRLKQSILNNNIQAGSSNTFNIGALKYDSNVIHYFYGYIDEFRIIKGKAVYTENFIPPTEPFNYVKKNNWTVNGNAKISIDQKFDGFSSLYLDGTGDYLTTKYKDIFDWIGDYTISFNIIVLSESATKYILSHRGATGASTGLGIALSNINTINIVAWNASGNTVIVGSTNKALSINKNYKIDIIKSNMNWSIYIDGVLDVEITQTENIAINTNNNIFIGRDSSSNYQPARDFKGYIKNFKIYKGVAVIPENPTGKIQLDFDNNLNDKYGNSTWTNNGVTFDQVNSVKGYASNYNSSAYISCGENNNLNFENKNFNISMDIKPTEYRNYSIIFGALTNWSANSYGAHISLYGSQLDNYGIAFGGTGVSLVGGTVKLNNYYNITTTRINGTFFQKINDVMISQANSTSSVVTNFNYDNKSQIGRGWNGSDQNNKYIGFIDNFSTYKEDLLNINTIIYKSPNVNMIVENESVYTTYNGNPTGASHGTMVFDDCPIMSNFIAELEIFIKSDTNNHGILNFRTTDYSLNNMDKFGYSAYISGGNIKFGKGSNNSTASWTEIATLVMPTKFQNNDYHTMKVIANGSNFKIFLDNELMHDVTDTTYSYTTKFGWCTYLVNNWNGVSSRIRSIKISDLSGNELYYKDWKTKIDNVIDKPSVHLPLETNSTNIGFIPLTINAVGNPTYTTIDGKKCIKFESGKYLTINSNNIFNLGTSSDFYLEVDFYVISLNSFNNIIRNSGSWTTTSSAIQILSNGIVTLYAMDNKTGSSSNSVNLNTFNNLKVFRKGNITSITLNGIITELNNLSFNFSDGGSQIGSIDISPTSYLNGYMSNFKMFVGTSEIPETYNDKKVLDLTFEPTRKSYLFKDKNNKCIIHPVNITQRDYQDSQYCCTFNGTDQYLELGKNDLLNFGLDDFVISMSFKIQDYINGTNSYFLLHSGGTTVTNERLLIAVAGTQAGTESKKIHFITTYNNVTESLFGDEVPLNQINNLIIYRTNGVLYLNFNGNVVSKDFNYPINGNISDNTYIGYRKYTSTTFFKGQIYSLKVLRNTNDLTLLDEVGSIFEESFTLSNGTDSQTIINDVKKDSHNIRFIKDTDKSKLIIDGEFVEVPSVENTSTELKLFENYNSEVKDVKLYNTVFEDEDIFLGNEPIDTVFGEIEYNEESEYELDIPEGDYTLKGFIEGYTDRDFFIYNTLLDYEIYRGTEYYNVNFMDQYSLDDYEINDLVTGAKYSVLKHEMIRGFISGTVNLKGCGVAAKDMKVYCYRDDTHRLIGIYSVDETGKYNIPNLDVNSKYDIIFKDETRKIKDQISNYRTPKVY